MVDMARFFMDFIQDESCGKCTPCREGTRRMLEILDRISQGKGEPEDLETLERLSAVIKDSALCGLGQTGPNPVLSTLQYFRHEYEAHIYEKGPPGIQGGRGQVQEVRHLFQELSGRGHRVEEKGACIYSPG